MRRTIGIATVLAGLLLYIPFALAQNEYEITFGNYIVNYNTFPSTFLDANIAKAVGVKRSDSRGAMTISVRHKTEGIEVKPAKATITATATNLIGQIRKIDFKEVKEGGALYYIGDFATAKDENLTFTITLVPEGETQRHEFKFSRQF